MSDSKNQPEVDGAVPPCDALEHRGDEVRVVEVGDAGVGRLDDQRGVVDPARLVAGDVELGAEREAAAVIDLDHLAEAEGLDAIPQVRDGQARQEQRHVAVDLAQGGLVEVVGVPVRDVDEVSLRERWVEGHALGEVPPAVPVAGAGEPGIDDQADAAFHLEGCVAEDLEPHRGADERRSIGGKRLASKGRAQRAGCAARAAES
jgi:hypothetical protein